MEWIIYIENMEYIYNNNFKNFNNKNNKIIHLNNTKC